MATAALISVSEYLSTSYRPDCDYVDGEVQERTVGTKPHSMLQALLAQWFNERFDAFGINALTEQRIQVAPDRFRIPDVCVLSSDNQDEFIIREVPLISIEVLSPEDRLSHVQERIDDYAALGVPNIWVFDPVAHVAWVAKGRALEPVAEPELTVTGTELRLNLANLFADLERRLHPRRAQG